MRTMVMVVTFLAAALSAAADEPSEPSVAEVCLADHARFCDEQSINSEGAMRCLMDHRQEVSDPCRKGLDARRQWVLDRVRGACANEIAAYCAREPADAPVRCLRHHESQLSNTCKATLPRWMS